MSKLNILNEEGRIIGEESREVIHDKGLLHREIHVIFYTPNNEIIFQHRAKDKDTYPDLLDATVGGHVEIGQSSEETAIKETKEETGINILPKDLKFIKSIKHKSFDKVTGKINYAIKDEFAYCFRGNISELKVEAGKAIGFEVWSINKILNISSEDVGRFIPFLFNKDFIEVLNTINHLEII